MVAMNHIPLNKMVLAIEVRDVRVVRRGRDLVADLRFWYRGDDGSEQHVDRALRVSVVIDVGAELCASISEIHSGDEHFVAFQVTNADLSVTRRIVAPKGSTLLLSEGGAHLARADGRPYRQIIGPRKTSVRQKMRLLSKQLKPSVVAWF